MKMFKIKLKSLLTISLEIFDGKFWADCGCSGVEVPRAVMSL